MPTSVSLIRIINSVFGTIKPNKTLLRKLFCVLKLPEQTKNTWKNQLSGQEKLTCC